MLPFGSQGANQAIEDAGALGLLLATVDDPAELPRRLELFETIRVRRASRVQILSSVRAGRENLVEDKVKAYLEPSITSDNISCGEPLVPNTHAARIAHDSG
jgi:salicylate hydroxylase